MSDERILDEAIMNSYSGNGIGTDDGIKSSLN